MLFLWSKKLKKIPFLYKSVQLSPYCEKCVNARLLGSSVTGCASVLIPGMWLRTRPESLRAALCTAESREERGSFVSMRWIDSKWQPNFSYTDFFSGSRIPLFKLKKNGWGWEKGARTVCSFVWSACDISGGGCVCVKSKAAWSLPQYHA